MASNKTSKTHTKNTPKVGYSDQSTINLPGAFEVKKMTLIASDGKTKDIRSLVESFTITTELFSPVITFSASLRDTEDLFSNKDFVICGQENIEVEIWPGTEKSKQGDLIKHTFSVKEYPSLMRTPDSPHVQIYTLIAISEFAYRSSLMNICRPLDEGKTLDQNIETIFKDDLRLGEIFGNKFEFVKSGDVETKFKGIINIQRPLQAAEWLRSRCFDEDSSPFFLYSSTVSPERIFFTSWKTISKQSATVATYEFKPFVKEKPGTAEHTSSERKRLLYMSSSLKLDRLKAANSGAYASRYNVIDFSSKAFYILDFTGDATTDWKPREYKVKLRDGTAKTASMHKLPSCNISTAHINEGISELANVSVGGVAANSITACLNNLPPARALYARLNETNHEIVVYGDSAMQPGEKIKLKVPKTKLTENASNDSEEDPIASGEYIILVAASIFSNGIFTNKLKVTKLVPSVTGQILGAEGTEGGAIEGEASTGNNINQNGVGKTTPSTESQKAYYNKMYNALYKEAVAKGLPNPDVVARLGAAQTCLETGYGTRMVGNNAFGIKAHTGTGNAGAVTASTKEVINGKTVTINDSFRAYSSVEDSAKGYIDFLSDNKRYSKVLASTNVADAVREIDAAEYATSSNYARDVGSIARKFQYEN